MDTKDMIDMDVRILCKESLEMTEIIHAIYADHPELKDDERYHELLKKTIVALTMVRDISINMCLVKDKTIWEL